MGSIPITVVVNRCNYYRCLCDSIISVLPILLSVTVIYLNILLSIELTENFQFFGYLYIIIAVLGTLFMLVSDCYIVGNFKDKKWVSYYIFSIVIKLQMIIPQAVNFIFIHDGYFNLSLPNTHLLIFISPWAVELSIFMIMMIVNMFVICGSNTYKDSIDCYKKLTVHYMKKVQIEGYVDQNYIVKQDKTVINVCP